MTRRSFIKGLGLFTSLPGAGRIWKAERQIYWRHVVTCRCFDQAYLDALEHQPFMAKEELDLRKLFDEFYRLKMERSMAGPLV